MMHIEAIESVDRTSGATIVQLTDYLAHSYHLYFTNPGWWDGGRRLLFGSDRGNASNLYSIDMQTRAISRITSNEPGDSRQGYQNACVNPVRDEGYVIRGKQLHAIDLPTGRQRVLFEAPEGWGGGNESCTADGRFVCLSLMRQVDIGPRDLGAGYIGFRELFEAHPRCQIIRVSTTGERNEPEVLFEEDHWIGHVNTSPVHPHILTFCHEGPWYLVDQRIWGLDMNTRKVWKIRPQGEGEMFGHEYWMQDGETIGYHGKVKDQPVYGFVRYDDTHRVERPFPQDSNHFHSNTPELIVADGPAQGLTPYVLLYRFDGERFEGPRVLCVHRGSRHIQHLHIHPRFTPDGKKVLFTADPRGYGQVYIADVPPFDTLPKLEDVRKK